MDFFEFFKDDPKRLKSLAGVHSHKNVKLSVSVHDQTQIETAFEYKLGLKEGHSFGRNPTYRVEAFLFFPKQMGVNSQTYRRDDFYEDLRALVRLREPFFTYKKFLGPQTKFDDLSPLVRIQTYVDSASTVADRKKEKEIIFQSRLFACSYVSHLTKRVQKINASYEHKENLHLIGHRTILFLKKSFHILKELRICLDGLERKFPSEHQDVKTELRLSFEFCLYSFMGELGRLAQAVDDNISQVSSEDKQILYSLQKHFGAWSRFFHYVIKKNKFLSISSLSSREERERYAFRVRSLKRRMWQSLYLYSKQPASFILKKQAAYMVAAAVAASWAVLANILIMQNAQNANPVTSGINNFAGIGSFSLIFAFILAYVLKDRIKEIGRERLDKGPLGNWPDHKEKLWHTSPFGNKLFVGEIEESFKFIEEQTSIPNSVIHSRRTRLELPLIQDEEVIHYKKKIRLSGRGLSKLNYRVKAVRDHLRLNVKRFLEKLDDPEQYYLTVDQEGHSHVLAIPKVYYLDMVLNYYLENSDGKMQLIGLECKRLTLNKDGLVNVDLGVEGRW